MKQVITVVSILVVVLNVFPDAGTSRYSRSGMPGIVKESGTYLKTSPPQATEAISPAEFSRAYGAYLAWTNDTSLQGILKDIAREFTKDDTLYIAVANTDETNCRNYLTANQINMNRVVLISTNSIDVSMWIRDFGPFYFYKDGIRSITRYQYRNTAIDTTYDFFPKMIADRWGFDYHYSPMILQGGNFMTDGNRMGFVSSVVATENKGWSADSIRNNLKKFLGLDSVIIIQSMQKDGTGHIDMAQKLLNDTLILVGEYLSSAEAYGTNLQVLNRNADTLSKMKNLDGRSFKVVRIPMPPYFQIGTFRYTPSYTNSLILNKKVLVPVYGDTLAKRDTIALNIYKKYMPDYEIIGINSAEIIKHWGAVHCITNTHFHANPMMILHDAVDSVNIHVAPVISFRLNPGFKDMSASVYYKPESGANYIEVQATLVKGIFSATLPTMSENFRYYLKGLAKSGTVEFPVSLPQDAPTSSFLVRVTTSSIKNKPLADSYIKLSQFPNPFAVKTTITYTVNKRCAVTIAVYNLKGRKISSIIDGTHKPGSYSAVWSGVDKSGEKLSSGLYYLVTTIGDDAVGTFKMKKEMVILR